MNQDTLSEIARTGQSTTGSIDYTLFRVINNLAGQSHTLDIVMIDLAKYSPLVYAGALALLWLTWKPRNQRAALFAGISALVALGLGQIVGYAFPRDRPYLAHHVSLLITHSPDTSFPSDHTTLAFAVAIAVWQFNRRAGITLLIFGVLVAVARVFVGAHYPGDVIGGAVLGAITSLIILRLVEVPVMRRGIERGFEVLGRMRLASAHDLET
ncbi:MAG TPA: undecaprenyl-diphosphatase [Gemmatimonadaceae bacterium]|nr:undecaprenyl-diphosphatase [Gemmatimonadaceae bacterium]